MQILPDNFQFSTYLHEEEELVLDILDAGDHGLRCVNEDVDLVLDQCAKQGPTALVQPVDTILYSTQGSKDLLLVGAVEFRGDLHVNHLPVLPAHHREPVTVLGIHQLLETQLEQ